VYLAVDSNQDGQTALEVANDGPGKVSLYHVTGAIRPEGGGRHVSSRVAYCISVCRGVYRPADPYGHKVVPEQI